jgi:CRISPR system Cascade subunit CasC
MSKFIQIHTLTSFPASLLNRDDAGFAKRMPFGDVTRTRISSQCLKRHWRSFDGLESLRGTGAPMSVRSRVTLEHEIFQVLKREGVDEALAREVTAQVKDVIFGKSDRARAEEEEAATGEGASGRAGGQSSRRRGRGGAAAQDETATEPQAAETPAAAATGRTGQVTVLGRPEIEYFLKHARAVCAEKPQIKQVKARVEASFKDARNNLAALHAGAGLDAALFGRMVTSDVLARGDAAVHVAHAFTVHGEFAETDYFSAIDELEREREDAQLGSGHIGTTELTSGLFYGYVVVDVPLLVSNIEACEVARWKDADRKLSAEVIRRLVHLIATVSPGAKLGSTAPHAYAQAVFVESGDAQPRTLANAFLRGVAKSDLLGKTYRALADHVEAFDGMYGWEGRRAHAAMHAGDAFAGDRFGARVSVPELAKWTAGRVLEG